MYILCIIYLYILVHDEVIYHLSNDGIYYFKSWYHHWFDVTVRSMTLWWVELTWKATILQTFYILPILTWWIIIYLVSVLSYIMMNIVRQCTCLYKLYYIKTYLLLACIFMAFSNFLCKSMLKMANSTFYRRNLRKNKCNGGYRFLHVPLRTGFHVTTT